MSEYANIDHRAAALVQVARGSLKTLSRGPRHGVCAPLGGTDRDQPIRASVPTGVLID